MRRSTNNNSQLKEVFQALTLGAARAKFESWLASHEGIEIVHVKESWWHNNVTVTYKPRGGQAGIPAGKKSNCPACGVKIALSGPGFYECHSCGGEFYSGPKIQIHCPECGTHTEVVDVDAPESGGGQRCSGCSNIFRKKEGVWALSSAFVGRFLGVGKVVPNTQTYTAPDDAYVPPEDYMEGYRDEHGNFRDSDNDIVERSDSYSEDDW